MRSSMLKFIILSILLGITRAHHFRTIVFAVLGLAGLWMVQNIAKSSNGSSEERSQLFPNFSVANLANRFLTKRSIQYNQEVNKVPSNIIDWDLVLGNDHSTCTRSYVCQLSASEISDLRPEETIILDLIRYSSVQEMTWAEKQIQLAVKNGKKWKNRASCMKMYRKCPYSSATMLMLINAFDKRT